MREIGKVMEGKQIIKKYGKCQVTISFKGGGHDSLDNVKWLLIESYCDRVNTSLPDEEKLSLEEKKKIS